jgi:gluconate 5-dehydrogenase
MSVLDSFSLGGKVALVTGGGRGIGKIIAEAYAEAGAKIVINGRREEYLKSASDEFKARGYDFLAVHADVTSEADVNTTIQAALENYGQIDILVNNAGQTWGQPSLDLPMEKWRQILEVNLNSLFYLSQQVARHMVERGQGGRIINIASVAGLGTNLPGMPVTLAYNISKSGVIHMTRNLAWEWGKYNILVNAIAPGWFPTRMASKTIDSNRELFENQTALGRIGDLDDLKGVAVFLASPASSYITGQTIAVDGGISL